MADEDKLTLAEEMFCLEMIKPGATQTEAYAAAYPNTTMSRKSLTEAASKKAADPKIKNRLAVLRERMLTGPAIADEQETLQILTMILRADPRKFYDENGKLKKLADLDGNTVIALQSIEGEGVFTKLRMYSRLEAADKLLRYHAQVLQRPPKPVEEGDTIENEPPPYEWARRMVLLITQKGAEG